MKRIIALFISLLMLLSMAACGGETSTSGTESVDASSAVDSVASDQKETTANEQVPVDVSLEETVIYDENDVRITVKGLEVSSGMIQMRCLMENNTKDKLSFVVDTWILNGITAPASGWVTAEAGESTDGYVYILDTELAVCGLNTIATIEVPEASILNNEAMRTVTEFSFSLNTSARDYTQPANDQGEVLLDQDGLTVIAQIIPHDTYGNILRLMTKNETGKNIYIKAQNVKINGCGLNWSLYELVYAGTVNYSQFHYFDSTLQDNGIETFEQLDFSLMITDQETHGKLLETPEYHIDLTK